MREDSSPGRGPRTRMAPEEKRQLPRLMQQDWQEMAVPRGSGGGEGDVVPEGGETKFCGNGSQ